MINIRLAKLEDVKDILPLMEQLGYPQTFDILQKNFEIFTNKEGYGIAVVEKEEKIIGWVAWSLSHLFVSSAKRMHIEGLVVDEKYRGGGVGKNS